MQTSINQMRTWRDDCNVVGGFVWVYNDETWSLNQWAIAMNKVFRSEKDAVVTIYPNANFDGESCRLPVGEYLSGDLAAYGLNASSIYSMEIEEGYMVTAFLSKNFVGTGLTLYESTADLGTRWHRQINSLKIQRIPDGVRPMADNLLATPVRLYDFNGRRLPATPLHGTYILQQGRTSRVIMKP